MQNELWQLGKLQIIGRGEKSLFPLLVPPLLQLDAAPEALCIIIPVSTATLDAFYDPDAIGVIGAPHLGHLITSFFRPFLQRWSRWQQYFKFNIV